MNYVRRSLAAAVLLVMSASTMPAPAAQNADAKISALARDYFYAGFRESPTSATATGVHDYDAQLDDMSAAAFRAHLAREGKTLAALQAIEPSSLSAESAIDRKMIIDQIQDDILLTGDLALWKHNPDLYTSVVSNGLFILVSRDFAPVSTRLRDAIARERQVPRLVRQAEANLTTVDSATRDVSLTDAQGAVDFLAHTVPQAFTGDRNATLQAQFRDSTTQAVRAVGSYAAFIKAIKPSGTYAIGKDAYEKRLQYEDELTMPLEQYLSYGEAALAKTHAQFIATAKRIDPNATPQQVYTSLTKVHPSPSQLLPAATQDLVRLRAFVAAHHIVTLPSDADIKVVETPAFERAFITAQMDSPGALEKVATQAYYNVTPVDPSWSKERQDGFLTQFNDYQRPIISLHEVYPGHYVNFIIDKHLNLSLTRKLIWNSEFGEGWAHYNEQTMVDQGWGNGDPHVRLAQLEEALLRECRYVVGVKLHTAGWSIAQAEQLFTSQCFQTPAVALEESMRGTQDPMYGYYTLGKLMILKLRSDYKKKLGSAFTLEKFHDALLAHGDPPIPLLRPLLLGSSDDGKPL